MSQPRGLWFFLVTCLVGATCGEERWQEEQCGTGATECEDVTLLSTNLQRMRQELEEVDGAGKRVASAVQLQGRRRRRSCNPGALYGQMSCPQASSTECIPHRAPRGSGVGVTADVGLIVVSKLIEYGNSFISGETMGLSDLLWIPWKIMYGQATAQDSAEKLQQYVTDASVYVTEQIDAAMLKALYNGILGLSAVYKQAVRARRSWKDGGGTKGDYRASLLDLIHQAVKDYPFFANPSPWVDPNGTYTPGGSTAVTAYNGWGVYYAELMTILLTANVQFILDFPERSETYQLNIVEYASKGVAHAQELQRAYVRARQADIGHTSQHTPYSELYVSCDSLPYAYANDSWSYYANGTSRVDCTWSVQNSDGYWTGTCYAECCAPCDDDTVSKITEFTEACRNTHYRQASVVVERNWDLWVIQPSVSWSKMADVVCQNTNRRKVKDACGKRSASGAQAFGKCCWNRLVQGCSSTSDCDPGGEGCIASGSTTQAYGVVVCNTCESQGLLYDPATGACTDSAMMLHYINDCNQCGVPWCTMIAKTDPNLESGPGVGLGQDLTTLGCGVVDSTAPVWQNSATGRVYVVTIYQMVDASEYADNVTEACRRLNLKGPACS